MKKYFLSALITLTSLFALAGGAQAEPGYVVVHIQQDFVAGGKALPAGTYRVYQDLPGTGQALVLLGDAAGASAILIPTMHVASSRAAACEADTSSQRVLLKRSCDRAWSLHSGRAENLTQQTR
jgi:hypothetical protein